MRTDFLTRSILSLLIGATSLFYTACSSEQKKEALTSELINQLRVPEYLGDDNEEEARLLIIKETLKQVMEGERDVNTRLDIKEWNNPYLVEAVILFDPPTALLEALETQGVDFSYFISDDNTHFSLTAMMAVDASYESLKWLAKNEKRLKPHPDRPPYLIARDLYYNRRLTNLQRETLIKALVLKGLKFNALSEGRIFLHVICERRYAGKEGTKEEKKNIILPMIESLFSIDDHINIKKNLHTEDRDGRVPWEIAYNNRNGDIGAALIGKMTYQEAKVHQDGSRPSHLERFKKYKSQSWWKRKKGYSKIKQAFLDLEAQELASGATQASSKNR